MSDKKKSNPAHVIGLIAFVIVGSVIMTPIVFNALEEMGEKDYITRIYEDEFIGLNTIETFRCLLGDKIKIHNYLLGEDDYLIYSGDMYISPRTYFVLTIGDFTGQNTYSYNIFIRVGQNFIVEDNLYLLESDEGNYIVIKKIGVRK